MLEKREVEVIKFEATVGDVLRRQICRAANVRSEISFWTPQHDYHYAKSYAKYARLLSKICQNSWDVMKGFVKALKAVLLKHILSTEGLLHMDHLRRYERCL